LLKKELIATKEVKLPKMLPKYRIETENFNALQHFNKANNKRRTTEEYIKELSIKNPNVEVLEDYINARTKILHRYKACGHEAKVVPYRILTGSGCDYCNRKKVGERNLKTHLEFVSELNKINNKIEIIGEYTGARNKVSCKCLICNYLWSVEASSLVNAKTGCPKCANNLKITHDEFVEKVYSINTDIEILTEYISANSKIKCLCKNCGETWVTTSGALIYNKTGCPHCKVSHGELRILNWLKNQNINFDHQYKVSDLLGVNGGKLSYDFFLPQYNLFIEYQGIQHSKPVSKFGGDSQFQIQQEHDKRKREYALNHKINLLEIWYYDINNIESILTTNLKSKSVETAGYIQ